MDIKEEIRLIKVECEKIIELEWTATKGPWPPASDFASHLVSEHSRNHGKLVCDFPDSTGDLSQFRRDRMLVTQMRGFSAPAARMILSLLESVDESPLGEFLLLDAIKKWKGDEK